MLLEYSVKTDVGKKREHNEDSYGLSPINSFFFVCDGMGGHAAGDYASQKVVSTILKLLKDMHNPQLHDLVPDDIEGIPFFGRLITTLVALVNRRIFNLAVAYPKLRGMGTTFTSIKFEDGFLNLVNVGDSRVYRFRSGVLDQLSIDHSWVEELLEDGELEQDELESFSKKNVITRAIGTNPEVTIDWKACRTQIEDIYLLCSDGLSGELNDNEICDIINKNKADLKKAASELIDSANNAGGSDNSTVILVKVVNAGVCSDPAMSFDSMVTIIPQKSLIEKIDSFNTRVFPVLNEEVPEGVIREKKKIHKNPVFQSLIGVLIIVCLVVTLKQPWNKGAVKIEQAAAKADLLIRSVPDSAEMSLFLKDVELAKKYSPADFLSLDEGEYKVIARLEGYLDKEETVYAYSGRQESMTIELVPLMKLDLNLGISTGFDPDEELLLNGEKLEYFGVPLTVQKIGYVGKTVNISQDKKHIISIGEEFLEFEPAENQDNISLKFSDGKIQMVDNEGNVLKTSQNLTEIYTETDPQQEAE